MLVVTRKAFDIMTKRPGVVLLVSLQWMFLVSPVFAQLKIPESAVKGITRTTLDNCKPTPAQLARRDRNNAVVKALGLHVLEKLPLTENEVTIKPRSVEEIVKRCVAVETCGLKAEATETENPMIFTKFVDRFQASTFFTPKEKAFIKNTKPSKREIANFNWDYERGHVLLWALGYVDKLKPANQYCDVGGEIALFKGKTLHDLIANAKPRSMKEIMDQADLYYRLHWASTELRLHDKHSDKIDEETVQERHYALNWLIRYQNEDWDEITTDT